MIPSATRWGRSRRAKGRGVSTIYVSGHRSPDTDSIASAIGYAELKRQARPAQRVRRGAAGRRQRADALGARPGAGARPRVPAPHPAARLRRHAGQLPHRRPPRADPRGRADHGPRGARARPDHRRRRRAGRRHDRAHAGPALHPRVARGDQPGRRGRAGFGHRRGPRGRARGGRGPRDRRSRVGPGHGRRIAAHLDLRGRRGRRRRPPRRPAPRARARHRAAHHEQRHGPRRRRPRGSPASAARRSSPRRWTATSRAGWSRSPSPAGRS